MPLRSSRPDIRRGARHETNWEEEHEIIRYRSGCRSSPDPRRRRSGLAQQNTRIIVVSHGQANDPFWSVVKNGVAAAGQDMKVQVDYRAPETFDMVAMGQLIDAAVNQKPAGLIVSIPDASALGPSIQKAVAAGIPVISMNSGSDVSKKLGALLHVGQDEIDAGRIAGAKLKEMGGKVGLCVNQEVGNVSLDLRCKGFAEGFGGKVTVLPVSNDPADIRAKVKAAVARRRLHRHHPGARRRHGRRAVGRGREGGRQDGRHPRRHLRPVGRLPQVGGERRGGLRHRPAAIPAGLSAGRVPGASTPSTA